MHVAPVAAASGIKAHTGHARSQNHDMAPFRDIRAASCQRALVLSLVACATAAAAATVAAEDPNTAAAVIGAEEAPTIAQPEDYVLDVPLENDDDEMFPPEPGSASERALLSESSYSFSYEWSNIPTPPPTTSPAPSTSAPTPSPYVVSVSLSLDGIVCSEFGADEEAALISAVAATIDGVEAEYISSNGCTDGAAGRRLDGALWGGEHRRTQSASSSSTVELDVSLPTTTASTLGFESAGEIVSSISSTLETALSSGELADNIAAAAPEGSPLASATVSNIAAFAATPSPTFAPSAPPENVLSSSAPRTFCCLAASMVILLAPSLLMYNF